MIKKCIILSDSLSALQALKGRNIDHHFMKKVVLKYIHTHTCTYLTILFSSWTRKMSSSITMCITFSTFFIQGFFPVEIFHSESLLLLLEVFLQNKTCQDYILFYCFFIRKHIFIKICFQIDSGKPLPPHTPSPFSKSSIKTTTCSMWLLPKIINQWNFGCLLQSILGIFLCYEIKFCKNRF